MRVGADNTPTEFICGRKRVAQMKNRRRKMHQRLSDFLGRDGVIRTLDPLHPMQVRYQAAPRPDEKKLYQLGYPLDGCVQECNDAIERFVQGFAAVWR